MRQTQKSGEHLSLPKESEHIISNQIKAVRLCYELSKENHSFLVPGRIGGIINEETAYMRGRNR